MKRTFLAFCILLTMIVVISCVTTPTTMAFATDGEQVEAPIEQSAGAKIRDWVYAQAAPLVAGVSSSAVIASILSVTGALIQRKLKKKLSENTGGINSLTGDIQTLYKSTKNILEEVKELKLAIESEVTTLKKLKKEADVAIVEAEIEEVIEQVEEISTETQKLSTPFLRS